MKSTTTLFAFLALAQAAAAGDAEFKGCYARWSETNLVVGNAHIERAWRIRDGLLTATSFRDKGAGCEWIAKPANRAAPYPAAAPTAEARAVSAAARTGRLSPVEAESLVLDLSAAGRVGFAYRFQIFPDARGVGVTFETTGTAGATKPAAAAAETATGIEKALEAKASAETGDALEDLELAPPHLRFTQVTLRDQTDNHNELVFETEWLLMMNEETLRLPGNVFFVENTLSGGGLIFLKQAPLPHARPVKSEWDAQLTAGPRRLLFAGQGYPFVLLAYQGGRAGRIAALQDWQRQLREYDPARDGLFLSNTWGDRSRDARINEAFILQEIEAGAKLGVDVVQIDDGWQKGRTANSAAARGKGVWNGYWAADPNFWQPDPVRFPRGLAPVVAAARAKGMKFGLWFGPDSSNDAANWRRDADCLLGLHRDSGIDYFKLDSIKAINAGTERNMHRFFDAVLEGSAGKVVFDLDVTAEIRPGYFGAPRVGPVFVENRYTDFHRYWPHQTLRNLWKLSQYVDPLRLRMEFLNNSRQAEKYSNDPLAPARYRPDCLFATVMFANPLGWFEVSNLPADYVAAVAPLVAAWKKERARLFGGSILPIGSAPDGVSWTGFAARDRDGGGGSVLLFRELSGDADWACDLPLFGAGAKRITVLGGEGTAAVSGGRLSAHMASPLGFLWARVDPAG